MKMLAVFVPDMHHKTLHAAELFLNGKNQNNLGSVVIAKNRNRAAMDNNYMPAYSLLIPTWMHFYLIRLVNSALRRHSNYSATLVC